MTANRKIRVALLYGGRSGEHEISLQSAASVFRYLDRTKFEIIPVAIDLHGCWYLQTFSSLADHPHSLPISKQGPKVMLVPSQEQSKAYLLKQDPMANTASDHMDHVDIDVVFPVLHGPLCEDGTMQGLLELADVPYVGCGVLASAIAMDKEMAKRVSRDAGIPIVPFLTARKSTWIDLLSQLKEQVLSDLKLPCFVKPANLGSSVGVTKVKNIEELEPALRKAFQYDQKVLIEKAIAAREIEVAILENEVKGAKPHVSVVGEITPHHEFYSYEAKYLDPKGASLLIPAKLSDEQMLQVKQLAQRTFLALEGEGMARIDFFLDKHTQEFYLNEMNTIPGFTSVSMYPKLWQASGISYPDLLTRLIELSISRHQQKQALSRQFHQSREEPPLGVA